MRPTQIHRLSEWKPFQLDALGLVSLLGAEEVNRAVGRLTVNKITEYLPLLAGYVVANDQLSQVVPGYSLYNISDALLATDVSSWFSRWIVAQKLTYTSTTVKLALDEVKPQRDSLVISVGLGVIINAGLIIFAVFEADHWAVAHAAATVTSVLVRSFVLHTRRSGIKLSIDELQVNTGDDDKFKYHDPVVCWMTLPNDKRIRLETKHLVAILIMTKPKRVWSKTIKIAQMFGWISFAIQAITLGPCNLAYQIIVISILIGSTLLAHHGIGEQGEFITDRLHLTCESQEGNDNPRAAYARLQLNDAEDSSMETWGIFPHKRNKGWWQRYLAEKQTLAGVQAPLDAQTKVHNDTQAPLHLSDSIEDHDGNHDESVEPPRPLSPSLDNPWHDTLPPEQSPTYAPGMSSFLKASDTPPLQPETQFSPPTSAGTTRRSTPRPTSSQTAIGSESAFAPPFNRERSASRVEKGPKTPVSGSDEERDQGKKRL